MGLEDDQEARILDHIEKDIIQSKKVNNSSQNMATTFKMVIAQLHQLLEQQNMFIEEMLRKQYAVQKQDNKAENTYTMDVELF